jgi:hypothetical protein
MAFIIAVILFLKAARELTDKKIIERENADKIRLLNHITK